MKLSKKARIGRQSPKALSKCQIGDILRIVLLDHADEDTLGAKALVFECFGRLVFEDEEQYLIMKWGDLENYSDHNNEFFSIIKSAVKEIKVLK